MNANAGNTRDAGLIHELKYLLEEEMATHSHTLAWKIPWTEELVGYSLWHHKESEHDLVNNTLINSCIAGGFFTS